MPIYPSSLNIKLTKLGMRPPRWLVAVLLIGTVLLAAGIWWALQPLLRINDIEQGWEQVPCELQEFTPRATGHSRHGERYTLDIRYRYLYQGRAYTSTRYCVEELELGYHGMKKRCAQLAQAAPHRCYVNPQAPAESYYEPGAAPSERLILALLLALFELLFIAALVDALIRRRRMRREAAAQAAGSTGAPPAEVTDEEAEEELARSATKVRPFTIGLCILLALASLYLPYGACRAAWESHQAREGWVCVPCQVEHAEWDRSGKAGKKLDIIYHYRYDGRDYESRRFDFWDSRTYFGVGTERIEQQLQSPQQQCYVNPEQPEEAVCDPSFSWSQFLMQSGLGLLSAFLLGREGLKALRNKKADP